MKKLIIGTMVGTSFLLLSGCATDNVAVENVVYDPGYSNDYVYSVGYFNNRPYWGNNYYYYSGYTLADDGYWGGSYYGF